MHKYCGVLTKVDNDYILTGNGEDINLSTDLDLYYMKDTDLHIKITNSKRTLLNESGAYYLDKNSRKEYVYHLNDIDISEILKNTLHDLVEITIEEVPGTGVVRNAVNL